MKEKFFTTEQVANILQVHPFTILKYIKQGKLKGIKLGRVYRIKESEINQFLEDRMTPGSRQPETVQEETEKSPQKTKDTEEEKKHYDIQNKDGDNHYYII